MKTIATPRYIGARVNRKEDLRYLTGTSRFLDDIKLPNMLSVGILRSPYGHAKLSDIRINKALRSPGVEAIFLGKDLPFHLPHYFVIPGMKFVKQNCLAVERVRYMGEPIAAIVATDRYAAEDAMQLIDVEYELLPAVVDAEEAVKRGTPLLYEEWGDNVLLDYTIRGGNVEDAFSRADVVIKERIETNRYTGVPMETRGYIADYDRISGNLTVWASTQVPHMLRTIISSGIKFPESKIRVIMPDVGAGYGLKLPVYAEEILIPLVAMKLGRPVKWMETRREHLMATHHARQQVHNIEVAAKKDGTLIGLRDHIIADHGAWSPTCGLGSQVVTALFLTGSYKVSNYYVKLQSVVTNKTPFGAYRGFGKETSNLVIERVMDILARKLGIDPVDIRMKNFIQPQDFPYELPSGAVYDSGNYAECLTRALELSQYRKLRREQSEMKSKGKSMGIGVVYIVEPSGGVVPESVMSSYESATIRITPSGEFTVLTGCASQGTGHETTLAQVAADVLRVSPDEITVVEGDTLTCPYGLGAWSSRTSMLGSSAVISASEKITTKARDIVAHSLDVKSSDLILEDGRFYSKENPSLGMTYKEVANIAYAQPYNLPPGTEAGLEGTSYISTLDYNPHIKLTADENGRFNMYPSYPNAAHIAVVEVDKETGKVQILGYYVVHDCGTMINPMIIEGQIQGGVAQGIGGAMLEELAYDDDGHLVASTFMDYLLPTSSDVPNIEVGHMETPSPFYPGGFKGCGEGGAVGAPAAIASAVEDALADYNVKITVMPLKPEHVYSMLKRNSSLD